MITGNRDTDTHLFRLMDDETLITVMSTNKELLRKGEEIFKERLRDNYPYLYKKKPYLETYKNYYLKMMYYIGKLKEEFDVDYIPVASFDPEGVYRGFSLKKAGVYFKNMNIYLIPYYAELKDEEKLKEISKSEFTEGEVLNELIAKGNIPLYEKLLAEWNINPFDINESGRIFHSAVKSGNKEIVDLFSKIPMDDEEKEDGGRKYFGSLGAGEIGSLEMLEYMNELFPKELLEEDMFVDIIICAAENGHVEFVRSFLNAPNFNFLSEYIPSILTQLIRSVSANFLPLGKLKQIVGMLLDYYFLNGGDKKLFSKRFKGYSFADPEITKFIETKLEEYN